MSIALWILALLGVCTISFGDKIVRILSKTVRTEKTENLVKLVGVLISVAALVLLWITGSFK